MTPGIECLLDGAMMLCCGFGAAVLPLHFIQEDGSCSCGNPHCKSAGKHPMHDLVPHGIKDADDFPPVVLQWWRKQPNANIGMAVCEALFAIDVDPRNGGNASLAKLVEEHGELPKTVTADTGGGGLHYLFRGGKGYRLRGQIAPGIDVKAFGGYIVAEPSNHVSGGVYGWQEDLSPIDVPPATAPAWLMNLLLSDVDRPCEQVDASRPAPVSVVERARRYVASCPEAMSGSKGHVATFRVAQALVRGFALGEQQALEILMHDYNPRCQPPWRKHELAHKIKQATRNGQMVYGGLL